MAAGPVSLDEFRNALLNFPDLPLERQGVYRDADLIFRLVAVDPSLANEITEIVFNRNASFEELLVFPNLTKASVEDMDPPDAVDLNSIPKSFRQLDITYGNPEQIARWLPLARLPFAVTFLRRGKKIANIAYALDGTALTSYAGINNAWEILSSVYALPYPEGLQSLRQTFWNIQNDSIPLLEVRSVPNRDLLPLLAAFQENSGLDKVRIASMYTAEQLEQELPDYARNLTLEPMLSDFFPAQIRAWERDGFLRWSCLPVRQRLRKLPLFREHLSGVFLGKWERRLDLIAASEKDPNIFGLAFKYGPEACYRSGLVKTRMTTLRSTENVFAGDGLVLDSVGQIPQETDQVTFLPVIRYAASAAGGLFFQKTPQDVCGTFYYYEPDSETGLRSNSLLSARNKYVMAELFLQVLSVTKTRQGHIEHAMLEFILDRLKQALGPQHVELLDLLAGRIDYSPLLRMDSKFQTPEGHYSPFFYAREDVFDQVLCRAGKYLGYEVLVFLEMSGKNRLVTEVLDTRSREESLENLYSLE